MRNASGVSNVLEAAAMGKAAVVSDVPMIRDFLIPGETCLQVPPSNPDALRGSIARLLEDRETCDRLGNNARRFAEQTCSPEVFFDRFAGVLRDIAL